MQPKVKQTEGFHTGPGSKRQVSEKLNEEATANTSRPDIRHLMYLDFAESHTDSLET